MIRLFASHRFLLFVKKEPNSLTLQVVRLSEILLSLNLTGFNLCPQSQSRAKNDSVLRYPA